MRYLVMAMRTADFKDSVVQPHKDYLAQLKQDGILELKGPFTDKFGGAYLLKADNLESAKAIAFNDPLHITGSSQIAVYEWDAA